MNVLKITDYNKTYKGKDGNDYPSKNYYLVTTINDTEIRIPIKPSFSRDYRTLDLFAVKEVLYNEDSKGVK